MPEEPEKKCSGTKRNGEPCACDADLLVADPADDGLYYCFSHHPDLAEERQASRRRGGLRTALRIKRGHRYLDASTLGALNTPSDALRWSAAIALGVATGTMSAAAGNAALKAVETFLSSLESTELERRIRRLERDGELPWEA